MRVTERMTLSPGATRSRHEAASLFEGVPLRRRMVYAQRLAISAGVVTCFGFILVAIGVGSEVLVVGAYMPIGFLEISPFIPWGIGVIGFGFLLGYLGAAIKGPSAEWRDVAPSSASGNDLLVRPPTSRYACPGCGGDVYVGQPNCPGCGAALPGSRAEGG